MHAQFKGDDAFLTINFGYIEGYEILKYCQKRAKFVSFLMCLPRWYLSKF